MCLGLDVGLGLDECVCVCVFVKWELDERTFNQSIFEYLILFEFKINLNLIYKFNLIKKVDDSQTQF